MHLHILSNAHITFSDAYTCIQCVAQLRDGSLYKGEVIRNCPGAGSLVDSDGKAVYEVTFDRNTYIFIEFPKPIWSEVSTYTYTYHMGRLVHFFV